MKVHFFRFILQAIFVFVFVFLFFCICTKKSFKRQINLIKLSKLWKSRPLDTPRSNDIKKMQADLKRCRKKTFDLTLGVCVCVLFCLFSLINRALHRKTLSKEHFYTLFVLSPYLLNIFIHFELKILLLHGFRGKFLRGKGKMSRFFLFAKLFLAWAVFSLMLHFEFMKHEEYPFASLFLCCRCKSLQLFHHFRCFFLLFHHLKSFFSLCLCVFSAWHFYRFSVHDVSAVLMFSRKDFEQKLYIHLCC